MPKLIDSEGARLSYGVYDGNNNRIIQPHGDGTFSLPKQSRVRAYRATSNQTISNITETKVQFNAEAYDNQAEFDPTTNYRFTAAQDGYYAVKATIKWASTVDQKTFNVMIYKNGANVHEVSILASGTGSLTVQATTDLALSATNYIEIYVYQNSGGNIDIAYLEKMTNLSIHKFG